MIKSVSGKKAPKKAKKDKKAVPPSALYVLDFNGDIKASQTDTLRRELNAVLSIAQAGDEIMVRLESPGGVVNGYGLAAAQLQRIRDQNIKLTVCIDKVAASGGYLMACVANHIIAAPFAIVGSIGVVAQMPNFHRWLEKHNIDVELLTAGEYKRTLTMFGENDEKGRKKFQEELEKIHTSFRNYILTNRHNLDIDEVSTGEHWLAQDALALRLVDEISTSDAWIIKQLPHKKVVQVKAQEKSSFIQKLLKPAMGLLHPYH